MTTTVTNPTPTTGTFPQNQWSPIGQGFGGNVPFSGTPSFFQNIGGTIVQFIPTPFGFFPIIPGTQSFVPQGFTGTPTTAGGTSTPSLNGVAPSTTTGTNNGYQGTGSTPWNVSSWNTTPWNVTPWNSTPWSSTPWNSTPWSTTPWNVTPWNSTPWTSTPWNSTPWNSTPWSTTPWNVNSFNTTPWNSTPWSNTFGGTFGTTPSLFNTGSSSLGGFNQGFFNQGFFNPSLFNQYGLTQGWPTANLGWNTPVSSWQNWGQLSPISGWTNSFQTPWTSGQGITNSWYSQPWNTQPWNTQPWGWQNWNTLNNSFNTTTPWSTIPGFSSFRGYTPSFFPQSSFLQNSFSPTQWYPGSTGGVTPFSRSFGSFPISQSGFPFVSGGPFVSSTPIASWTNIPTSALTEFGGWQNQSTPGFWNAVPGFTNTLPGYVNSLPGFTNTFPGYVNSVPGFTNTFPGFTNTIPGLVNTFPGYTNSFPGSVQPWGYQSTGFPSFGVTSPSYFAQQGPTCSPSERMDSCGTIGLVRDAA